MTDKTSDLLSPRDERAEPCLPRGEPIDCLVPSRFVYEMEKCARALSYVKPSRPRSPSVVVSPEMSSTGSPSPWPPSTRIVQARSMIRIVPPGPMEPAVGLPTVATMVERDLAILAGSTAIAP
ncbi:hypothetical protein ACIRQY_23045 [Streptomyces sp. NPDC101490]|uniref:hypothetical protein n=1 Tax=Streptomyces sp. NPDC101490 TaxID=3366143 RepID=UPI0038027B75